MWQCLNGASSKCSRISRLGSLENRPKAWVLCKLVVAYNPWHDNFFPACLQQKHQSHCWRTWDSITWDHANSDVVITGVLSRRRSSLRTWKLAGTTRVLRVKFLRWARWIALQRQRNILTPVLQEAGLAREDKLLAASTSLLKVQRQKSLLPLFQTSSVVLTELPLTSG